MTERKKATSSFPEERATDERLKITVYARTVELASIRSAPTPATAQPGAAKPVTSVVGGGGTDRVRMRPLFSRAQKLRHMIISTRQMLKARLGRFSKAHEYTSMPTSIASDVVIAIPDLPTED